MKVVAIARGYLGQVREPGQEFEAPDGMKSSWFKAVKAAEDKPKAPTKMDQLKADAAKFEADALRAASQAALKAASLKAVGKGPLGDDTDPI